MKRFFITAFLALVAATTYTQPNTLSDPEPHFSAVIVSDIDTAIQWYADHLGFKIVNRTDSEARGFKQANLKRGHALIELIQTNTAIAPATALAGQPGKKQIAGYFKFGFRVSDFDQWISFLKKSGVTFHGKVVRDPVSGKKMVLIKDPDGNRIQLFEK